MSALVTAFAPGDPVTLKCEEVVMVVSGIRSDGLVMCVWLDPQHHVQTADFPPEALKSFAVAATTVPNEEYVSDKNALYVLRQYAINVDSILSDGTMTPEVRQGEIARVTVDAMRSAKIEVSHAGQA